MFEIPGLTVTLPACEELSVKAAKPQPVPNKQENVNKTVLKEKS